MPLLSTVVPEVWRRILQRRESGGPIGLPTGITELDELIGLGWNRQELSWLAGDSGVGKSYFISFVALQGAKFLASHPGWRPNSIYLVNDEQPDLALQEQIQDKEGKQPLIVVWSLEMSELPIVARMTTQAAKILTGQDVDSKPVRLGRYSDNEKPVLATAYAALEDEWGKYVYLDFDSRSVQEHTDVLSDLALRYDVCLVLVDYFRRIEEMQAQGIAEEQGNKSRGLSDIAKFFDTHVCCVFDITREAERAKHLGLHHLKGGTAAKFDADIIILMEEFARGEEDSYERIGVVDMKVAKNRHGETGLVRLQVDRATGNFLPV